MGDNTMKRYLFLAIIFFMASSCSMIEAYNTPFIDSEDVVKLEFGMSKNNVLYEADFTNTDLREELDVLISL